MQPSRSLRGSVDWNFDGVCHLVECDGRSLRGSVDWNTARKRWRICYKVAPFVGVWIEISVRRIRHYNLPHVAPFVGVWIEIYPIWHWSIFLSCRSLRGSVDWNKVTNNFVIIYIVAPFVGVWIEIFLQRCMILLRYVAPFVGVWIEITTSNVAPFCIAVAPFVGVWIEILIQTVLTNAR